MKASYIEVGERPALLTPARQNAPAFGKAIVDVLSEMSFGYDAAVILDWDGSHAWAGQKVDDFGVYMYVVVNATPDGRNVLTAYHRLAIDDDFGNKETREGVLEVTQSLFETVSYEMNKWKEKND